MGEKKRLEYIDLMKGICITMVILLHCGFFQGKLALINEYLKIFRMPLYFFLSGLFFKTYGGFSSFTIKKINNLVLPYLFFSLLYLIYFTISAHNNIDYCSWKYYFFGLIEPYNYPLWFLRSLFITYTIYYILQKLISDSKLRILASFITSIFVFYITPSIKEMDNILVDWIYIYLNVLTSFFVLPYIAVAEQFKNKGLLTLSLSKSKCTLLFFVCLFLSITMYTKNFDLKSAEYGNNLFCLYTSSFLGIFAIYFFSRIFNRVFFFSHIGRYSIIALGIHTTLELVIKDISTNIQPRLISLIVLVLCPLFIQFFKKYFPYFTAQKELFKSIKKNHSKRI